MPNGNITTLVLCVEIASLMPSLHAPPGKKQSGEQSQISWAYSPKVVRTNAIARLVIKTEQFPHNNKFFFYLYSSVHTIFEQVGRKHCQVIASFPGPAQLSGQVEPGNEASQVTLLQKCALA